MFRTIKQKLPYNKALIETAKQFKEATQIVLDYGFELDADLNASRNIEFLGKSEYFTFLSTNRCGSMKLHP